MGVGPSVEERSPQRPPRPPTQQKQHSVTIYQFLDKLEATLKQSSTTLMDIHKKGLHTEEARKNIIDLMKATKHILKNAISQQNPTDTPANVKPPDIHQQYLTTEELMKELNAILQHWTKMLNNVKTSTMGTHNLHGYIQLELKDTEAKLDRILNIVSPVPVGAGRAIDVTKKTFPSTREDVAKLMAENAELEHKLDEERSQWAVEISKLQDENDKLRRNNTKLKSSYQDLKSEYDSVLSRLSKMMGEKLVANNPAIADLSDPNRPTKLAEVYAELYDNEWTNAFEGLTDGGYEEMQALETLREILIDTVAFCQTKSDQIVTTTEKAVNQLFDEYQKSYGGQAMRKVQSQTMIQPGAGGRRPAGLEKEPTFLEDLQMIRKWKPVNKSTSLSSETPADKTAVANVSMKDKLVKLRKEMSLSLVPVVYKAYLKPRWDKECIAPLKPFIKKCLFVGWMMMVQAPRLVLVPPAKCDSPFDNNLYTSYTARGPTVAFVVWPAMLLHDGGPVLRKGIAQGKR